MLLFAQGVELVEWMVSVMKDGRKKHAIDLEYPMDLVQPIVKVRLGSGILSAKEKLVEDEFLRKIYILMEHYDINEEANHPGWDLLFAVVKDWIPGFEILETSPRGRGAPRKNTIQGNDELVVTIDQIIEGKRKAGASKRDCSVIAACITYRKLSSSDPRWRNVEAAHIKNQYFKAKKSFNLRRKMADLLSTPSIWNSGLPGARGLLAPEKTATKQVEIQHK